MEDSGTRFLRYEPLLWKVQARLARDGYAIEPQDARDFIHDFYLEWNALTQRYRPQLGAFEPYLVTAFYQFCRRRYFKLSKLRSLTAELEAAAELPSAAAPIVDAVDLRQQLDIISNIVDTLAANEQAILQDFLGEQDMGERELARKHGLSRYRLREVLAELVGRIALQMTATPYEADDAKIVRRLWLEGYSPKMVAAMHGISVADVHAAKNRFSQVLLNSIRSADRPPTKRRKIVENVLGLLKQAILANDAASIAALQQHAGQVRQALDADGDVNFSEHEMELIRRSPEGLAAVYEALGRSDESSLWQGGGLAAIDTMHEVQAEIGRAWEVFAGQLEMEGHEWDAPLRGLGVADREFLQHLSQDPSFMAGGEAAQKLLNCGMTPSMLYEALDNIRLLFNRVVRRPAEQPSMSAEDAVRLALLNGDRLSISRPRVWMEVSATRDLMHNFTPNSAQGASRSAILMEWIMNLLQFHPFLIDGYAFHPVDAIFYQLPDHVPPDQLSFHELVQRWCWQPAELESRLYGVLG